MGAERRRAEREERKSLEKERVERAGGRMEPILESSETACTVASVASSDDGPSDVSLMTVQVADDVEQEREALRRTGAIPKRLANRGRQERNPQASRRWTRRPLQTEIGVEKEAQRARRSGQVELPRGSSATTWQQGR